MSNIYNLIFNRNDPHYIANYGWQDNFGEGTVTFGYIDSYRTAAEELIELTGQHDLLLFPIMFCYRQYLELVLKNICYQNMSKEDYEKFIKKSSHNLIKIWSSSLKYLNNVDAEGKDLIDQIIKIFDCLDENSFTFRYEFDKKNNKSIKQDKLAINMFELKKIMDTVDNYIKFTYDEF